MTSANEHSVSRGPSDPVALRRAFRVCATRVLAVALFVFVPFVLVALWFRPLAGDLTRLGAWSERDFAWTSEQPRLEVFANPPPGRDPDLLVLGDSFAMGNVWQSELQRSTGVVTLSFGYEQARCLDAFVEHALSPRHAGASVIIVQTIERYFVDRFESAAGCSPGRVDPFHVPAGHTGAQPAYGPLAVDWRYLLRTAGNSLKLASRPQEVVRDPEVVNVPLATDGLFSNRRSTRMLYYAGDDAKKEWSPSRLDAALSNAVAIDRRLRAAGRRLLVVVIPDKSSVYREHVAAPAAISSSPDVWRLLRERGVEAVGLLEPMRSAARTTVDLYMPNDTHLSAAGFALLGREVARWGGFTAAPAR